MDNSYFLDLGVPLVTSRRAFRSTRYFAPIAHATVTEAARNNETAGKHFGNTDEKNQNAA
ncbi:hypothetical protein FLLO111716_09865 [Flavobacterium longum]